jgi:hypothetical protein
MEMPDLEECIVCYEETLRFSYFPCNHKVCTVCFPKLRQCPLCQTEIRIQIRPEREIERGDKCKLCCSIFFMMAFCVWCLKITRTI